MQGGIKVMQTIFFLQLRGYLGRKALYQMGHPLTGTNQIRHELTGFEPSKLRLFRLHIHNIRRFRRRTHGGLIAMHGQISSGVRGAWGC